MAALPQQGMTAEQKKKLAFDLALAGISLVPGGLAVSSVAKAAQAGTKALPWLVRAERGLMAGEGWNIPGLKKFYNVPRATAPTFKRTYERYPKGTIAPDGKKMGGKFTGKYDQTPSQAGLLRRRPITSALLGTGAAMGTYPLVRKLGDGDTSARSVSPSAREVPWSVPKDMMTYAEGVEASAKKKNAMLKDMVKYSVLISALGQGGGRELMEQMMDVMDAELEGEEDVRFAKAVQAVYGGGNPPQNAREAYERLAPIVGPEHAATLSGHQLGFEPKRTASERLRRDIIDALETGGREAAINVITLAWSSDPGIMPQSAKLAGTSEERLRAIAGQMVDSIQSGGSALIHSVEDD